MKFNEGRLINKINFGIIHKLRRIERGSGVQNFLKGSTFFYVSILLYILLIFNQSYRLFY